MKNKKTMTLRMRRAYLRAEKIADLIIENDYTIRKVAKELRLSKSCIHRTIHMTLPVIDSEKYKNVQEILSFHFEVAHINGALATKEKYRSLREDFDFSEIKFE